MTQFITGTFSEAALANRAVAEIVAAGHPLDDISIIMNGEIQDRFADAIPAVQKTSRNAARSDNRATAEANAIGAILAESARRNVSAMRSGRAGVPERFVVAGPAAAVLRRDGNDDARNGDTVEKLALLLGMPRNDAERLDRDVGSGAIAVGVKASNGERVAVERILRTNAARIVVESLTAS